jgi:hypothetical protein
MLPFIGMVWNGHTSSFGGKMPVICRREGDGFFNDKT